MAWFKDWFNTSYYHLLYGERDEAEAGQFIRKLTGFLNPGKDAVFLDLACGKGRHSVDIAAMGYTVYGVDLSSESIREAAARSGERLHFAVHDMRDVYIRDRFDYVVNLFTSFGYFEERSDNLKTLKAVCADLKKGGVFVQDYFNAEKVVGNLLPLEFKEIGGIRFEIRKEKIDQCIIKTIKFTDRGCAYQFREKVSLFDLHDFKDMYSQCGLEILHVFGDYHLNAFDSGTSDRLILISRKQ